MKLTVAVCTWNRAALLERTLASLFAMQRPRADWELIVVDNNSTDDTPAVIERWANRLPLRRTIERKQGLSHARNAAIDDAAGDYLVWTDDDVQVSERWLVAYEAAIGRHSDAAIFGGPIQPLFERDPPAWLAAWMPEVESAFGCREFGPEERALHPTDCIPFGANFALRMAEQRTHRFDPALGRVKEGGTLGEETTVMRALLRAGSTGTWVPDAPVRHWIPVERMSQRYLGTYYRMYGKTLAQWGTRPGGRALAGVPLWLWRKQAAQWWRYQRLRATRPDSRHCALAFVDWNETSGLIEALRGADPRH